MQFAQAGLVAQHLIFRRRQKRQASPFAIAGLEFEKEEAVGWSLGIRDVTRVIL